MRKPIIAFLFLFPALLSAQNVDNTQYVKAYIRPGVTVGQAVTAAQAACNPDLAIPCIIVFDPSLAKWTAGSLPTKCTQCQWLDFRAGLAYVLSSGGVLTGTITGPGFIGPVTGHASGDLPLTGGNVGPINATFVNNICKADQQTGADAFAKINACNTALVASGGGIIDARGFGATTQNITVATGTNPLIIGGASASVTLKLDRTTNYQVTATGGGDAIQLYSKSAITCEGGSQSGVGIYLTGSSSVATLISTYPHNTGNTFTSIRNCTLGSNANGTVTDAVLDVYNPTDETILFGDIFDCHSAGVCKKISQNGSGGSGNVAIENNSTNCNATVGCIPTQIIWNSGGILASIHISGGTDGHPGCAASPCTTSNGLPIVDVEGCNGSDSGITGLSIDDIFQMESSNVGDIGIRLNCVHGATIDAAMTTNGAAAGLTMVQIEATSGTSSDITVSSPNNFGLWTNTISDLINSKTQPAGDFGTYKFAQNPTGTCGTIVGDQSNPGVKVTCNISTGYTINIPVNVVAALMNNGKTYSTCADTVINWPVSFGDTNYSVACSGAGIMTGNVTQIWASTKTATGITVSLQNGSNAAGATISEVDCVGVHP